MNAKETERIIAFHGARRGAARIRAGAEGTRVSLTLRPGTKGAPVPTAICLAGLDGRALRIPLSGSGSGAAAEYLDPAVLLLIADSPTGEVFCGEGARGALERRVIEGLKQPLRGLRRAGAPEKTPAGGGERTESAPAEENGGDAAAGRPGGSGPDDGTPAKGRQGNGRAAGQAQAPAAAPQKQRAAEPMEEPGRPAPPAPEPHGEPRSEALRSILKKAEELFPEHAAATAESHFASDAPLGGAFIPRPIAPEAERKWQRRSMGRCPVPAGMAGRNAAQQPLAGGAPDPAWRDAVRELSRPETAPKPAGVGAGEPAGILFPEAFPDVRWRRVRYPGTRRYYLEGMGRLDGSRVVIYALPGEDYPAEPYRGRGFTHFLRDVNGHGYWVKVKRQGS